MPKPENIPVKIKPEPIDNTALVEEFRQMGGRVVHVRPRRSRDGKVSRGLTAAYVTKGGRIEFSTAVQHRADGFAKKIGTKTAIEHFKAGRRVTMPMPDAFYLQHKLSAFIY